ncbi:MAG: T9SS type A sorting domain-containing protein, partial [Chitinispirillaceae bacterium]|nr:T9SS type A sorting domain-containing protein [Chitinispirillaceae bacterium]
LSLGVSPNQAATTPAKIRLLNREFCYSGGPHPMRGRGASPSIEIGLDVSDLIDSLAGSATGKFFLIVDSKGGSGTVDSLSFMDYTSGTVRQTKSAQTNVSITPGTASSPAKTYIGVAVTLNGARSTHEPFRALSEQDLVFRSGHETARVRVPFAGPGEIALFDLRGNRRLLAAAGGSGGGTVSTKELPAGAYLMNVRSTAGKGQAVRRISIVR